MAASTTVIIDIETVAQKRDHISERALEILFRNVGSGEERQEMEQLWQRVKEEERRDGCGPAFLEGRPDEEPQGH